ncbi:hypothetical protein SAY86_023069 [Trapa natans]|uniref:Man1/Src1-like C-terminal domain-containing protein n=1 Tax=Trapa natans TaxID=22666 RepID=A0AAN7R5D0_TRANT|nr:hypothetical protein SAY86_023069 [Trapa natans]
MSSTPKRRQRSKLGDLSSSRSSHSSLTTVEPPSSFFPSRGELLNLVAVVAIASAVAVSCNFFVGVLNPQVKPFCDNSADSFIHDSCEPCPVHGECHQGELECMRGYKKRGRACIEDGDIAEIAKQLSEWVEFRLCESYAQVLCGGAGTAWVQEADILSDIDGQLMKKNFDGDSSLFMYARIRVMESLVKLLETQANPSGMKEFKCPDASAEYCKPYSCRIRQWLLEHALIIVPVCILVVGVMVLTWRIHKKQYLSTRVEEIYNLVCDMLEENALMTKGQNGEPWVVAAWLRDHLLLPNERKDPRLWKQVEELIQEDSRVDRYLKLVKGEQKVVWEWQAAEGSLSYTRSRKFGETGKSKLHQVMDASSQRHELTSEPRALIL